MRIRILGAEETDLLKDFLYEAIFIPEGVKAPEKDIVEIEGDTLTITAELGVIMETLLNEGFPKEGIELALKLAEMNVGETYGA